MPQLYSLDEEPLADKVTDEQQVALMFACIARDAFCPWCRDFVFIRPELGVEYGRIEIQEETVLLGLKSYFLIATIGTLSGGVKSLARSRLYFEADPPSKNKRAQKIIRRESLKSGISIFH